MVVGRIVYGGKVDTIENLHLLNKKRNETFGVKLMSME
jgi:hypothetical protein